MKDNSASDYTQITRTTATCLWSNNREKTDPKSNPRRMLPQSMSSDAFSRSARRDRNQEVVGNRVASTGKWSAPPYKHWRSIVTLTCVVWLRNKPREPPHSSPSGILTDLCLHGWTTILLCQ